ncbi:contractile injection system protein, VgrG/Pvc8 family [Massilia sp. DJPM01]|uniref:phage late control D family protein n=1 Tax=Massilia sp. DJPM01 TaxID=3024404 RepID=UPI00259D40CF|nr:contractile injection system protein, VgrG/Pvc8 family [Massilia sp. DJPM01]MDM5178530.1 contractile injection system protein, VgrG/Pvc8 family [Massilia sp. DJPM01]
MKPTYQVLANSTDITAVIESRFLSLSLTDETGITSDMLEIKLSDYDPAAPIQKPPKGAELEVFLGYDGVNARMGMFCVDEIEYSGWPGEMTVRARGAIFDKTPKGKANLQSQKTRSWAAGTTLGAMVTKIAKEHGMEGAVSASLKSVALPYVAQQDESDLNLLVRLGKKYDVIVKPANGRLILAKRGESKSVGGQVLTVINVTPASGITSFHVMETARDSSGTVIAYYHKMKQSKRHEVKVGNGEPVTRLKQYQPTKEMAIALAQAELAKRDRQKSVLSLTLPGRPAFGAEGKLITSGFREGVDNEWVITRVTHSLTKDGGYSCSIEAELPTDSRHDINDIADVASDGLDDES